jgi:integrase
MNERQVGSGAFRQALLKSERLRILTILGSLGTVFIVHTIRTVIVQNREDFHFGFLSCLVVTLFVGYELLALDAVKRATRANRDLPRVAWVGSTIVETSLPAFGVAFMTTSAAVAADRPLANPAALVFFLFIIVSTLPLNPWACRLCGFVVAVTYLPVVLSGKNLTLNELADWFLERRSRPPFKSENTHAQNLNALKHIRPAFGALLLSEITPEAVEEYVRVRLDTNRKIRITLEPRSAGPLKPSTIHQEFRILTRMLNIAIKQRWLAANPCICVEFPVSVSNSTWNPHYMTATEQAKIEFNAPGYLRNAIVILTEMGLRPFKELMPMKKSQIDLENAVVHISDSKTPSLRHTFATRLSAGGVADHFVTQMLRQGDSKVFKRYSQAKFNMMREALARLDRQANEHNQTFGTARPN